MISVGNAETRTTRHHATFALTSENMSSIYQGIALLFTVSAFVGALAVRRRQPRLASCIGGFLIAQDQAVVIAMMIRSRLTDMRKGYHDA